MANMTNNRNLYFSRQQRVIGLTYIYTYPRRCVTKVNLHACGPSLLTYLFCYVRGYRALTAEGRTESEPRVLYKGSFSLARTSQVCVKPIHATIAKEYYPKRFFTTVTNRNYESGKNGLWDTYNGTNPNKSLIEMNSCVPFVTRLFACKRFFYC